MNIFESATVFSFSAFIFLITLVIKKTPLTSFNWIFIFFILLYTVFPFLTSMEFSVISRPIWSLYAQPKLVSELLLISALCIFGYLAFIFILPIKDLAIAKRFVVNRPFHSPLKKVVLFFLILLYPFAFYFARYYGWGPNMGQLASLTSLLRNILMLMTIWCFLYHTVRVRIILLSMFIIFAFVDFQRTNLLIVLLSFYLTLPNKFSRTIQAFILLSGVLTISYLGTFRMGQYQFSFRNLIYPFYTEGNFGSYGVLQSIHLENSNVISIDERLSLFLDEVLILFTYPINKILSLLPYQTSILDNLSGNFWPRIRQQGWLTEDFFPIGGYYFLAMPHLIFPYIGPIIYTICIYLYTKICLLIKNKFLRLFLYSCSFLWIKATLLTITKFLFYCCLLFGLGMFFGFLVRLCFSGIKSPQLISRDE